MKPLNDLVNRIGRSNLIVIVAIVVLLILGFFLLSGKSPITQLFQPPEPIPGSAVLTPTPTPTTVPGDTIMLTFSRAVPKTLTLKKGRVVNFVNFSGTRVNIEGVDAQSKILSIGVLEDNGTSDIILLETPGTYKYVDVLNSKIAGEIIVTP